MSDIPKPTRAFPGNASRLYGDSDPSPLRLKNEAKGALTRASLLTGRNHHSVHMGGITEIANSLPAYDSAIPPESATIAEVLKQHGYSA